MIQRKKIALITLALAVNVSTAGAETILYSNDFNDPSKPLVAVNWVTFELSNQQLVLTCTRDSATDPDNLITSTGGVDDPSVTFPADVLPDQETLELRVDLIGANQDDAFADIHWGNFGNGYGLTKNQNQIILFKAWNNFTSWAFLFATNQVVKNDNATLALSFTHLGSDLKITARVLDKENAKAVLFEHTVIDTPQVDPTFPNRAVKGILSSPDPAGTPYVLQYTGYAVVGIAWLDPERAPSPLAQVTYDNLQVQEYESPQLTIQQAVVLSWPLTEGQFILESAPGVNGPWTPVIDPWWRSNAGRNEMCIPAPESLKLFRLSQ